VHPADVAPFVAASVQELVAQVATRPALGVRNIELRDTRLFIRFEIATSAGAPNAFTGTGAVPIIGTRRAEELILAMDCEDWDSQPPTAELLDLDEQPLPADRWPHDPSHQGIVEGHWRFGSRKFFCRVGLREFHTHPQHEDEPWDAVREGTSLAGIVTSLLYDLTHRWRFR
jgi:hypothetical protein